MIQTKWTEEHIDYIKELQKQGLSSNKAIDKFNKRFNTNMLARALRENAAKHGTPFENHGQKSVSLHTKQTQSWNADGVQTSETIIKVIKGQKMSDEDLLRAHGYDPDKFILANAISNFWKQTPEATLFQTKISIKPKNEVSANDYVDIFNSKIEPIHILKRKTGKNNLVIPLYDMHWGWTKLKDVLDMLGQIQEIISNGYDEIHIIIGGDSFHSNLINKTMTAKGTQLDHADNVQALKDGTEFFSRLLEYALANSNKTVIHAISGNHDRDKQYMWIYAMQFKYPDVEINNTNRARDAFKLSNIGVMIAHGDLALKRLPMLFATEYPMIWASSTYRLVFTGHYHQEKVSDDNGVVVHQCGTPKPLDNYEDDQGFSMSRRKIQVFEFSTSRLKATYEIEKEHS
ncbi:MAG: hypothetical protein ABF991_03635 [Liquorilactobacillus hordei]